MKIVLIFLGLVFVFYNWIVFYRTFFKRHRVSWVPIFGGLTLATGIYLSNSKWWWLSFFVDYGSFPGMFYNFFLYKWIDPLITRKYEDATESNPKIP